MKTTESPATQGTNPTEEKVGSAEAEQTKESHHTGRNTRLVQTSACDNILWRHLPMQQKPGVHTA